MSLTMYPTLYVGVWFVGTQETLVSKESLPWNATAPTKTSWLIVGTSPERMHHLALMWEEAMDLLRCRFLDHVVDHSRILQSSDLRERNYTFHTHLVH